MSTDPTEAELRQILASLTSPTSDDLALTAPADTALLREGLGLDSLGGALLLRQVRARFGVDVADEDLNLDCLATIGTLTAFIANRRISR